MKSVMHFLHEVRIELSKIIWPKFDSFLESTIVVLVFVFAFTIYLGLVDKGIVRAVEYIFKHYV